MDERPTTLAIAWTAAWLALASLTAGIVGPWMDFYAAGSIELPWITLVAVTMGEALRSPIGWFVLAALLVLGLLPLHLGVGGREHQVWLRLGIVQAGAAALLLWAALELPLAPLKVTFQTDAAREAYEAARPRPPLDLVGRSALFTAPAVFLLVCAQVAAWIKMSVRVASLPRVEHDEEALRAIVVAVLPGAALAIGAYSLVEDLRPAPSEGLLVDPSLAAAGTAVLVTYGAALLHRIWGPNA